MNVEKIEDVKDTAIKLGAIHSQSPTDYFYLKGWIHCLLQKEEHVREDYKLLKKIDQSKLHKITQ